MNRLKATRTQVDDRIVEVHWDPVISQWRMMRFRDDKPTGNHKSTVENVISSIVDGVEKEAVRSFLPMRCVNCRLTNVYSFWPVPMQSEMPGKRVLHNLKLQSSIILLRDK